MLVSTSNRRLISQRSGSVLSVFSSLMRSRRLFRVSRRMLSTSGSGITSWMRLPTNRLAISDCGSEKTWMTEPVSTTLPKSMTATLLQIFWMTFISCVIITIVIWRVSLIFFSKSRMESVVFGSRALVASSQRRIDGLFASALAIPTRCFCPPESCPG